jgi:hypothetical protein
VLTRDNFGTVLFRERERLYVFHNGAFRSILLIVIMKPTMIRIVPDLLERIDQGAKRLGISRSAFICSSTAEKLERIGHNRLRNPAVKRQPDEEGKEVERNEATGRRRQQTQAFSSQPQEAD